MLSLTKTPQSISYGRVRAQISRELRKNNMVALSLEFGERAYLAAATQFETHKVVVLGAGA
ncbi:hypothetical protein OG824_13525 [Streptomyces prunicolor]|uniref:hypothetical protein n=1 Tax=Streptomyces prunicolor TaxID=67348 RepID=UPI002255A1BB|nr:hypothetical protein [Streptomyces prunicolor]MCX5236221.1 hypothetical protein [Streptomyces prunicolor]